MFCFPCEQTAGRNYYTEFVKQTPKDTVVLTLLPLEIKNIRLGPTLTVFVFPPNVLNFLVEKFGIGPITTPEEDHKMILG